MALAALIFILLICFLALVGLTLKAIDPGAAILAVTLNVLTAVAAIYLYVN